MQLRDEKKTASHCTFFSVVSGSSGSKFTSDLRKKGGTEVPDSKYTKKWLIRWEWCGEEQAQYCETNANGSSFAKAEKGKVLADKSS